MAKKQREVEQEVEEVEQDEETSEQSSINVLDLLRQDHQEVKRLFDEFPNADGRARQDIAEQVLKALETHTKIEEEHVYPAIAEAIEDQDKIDEANEEHHVVTLLIKELKKMKASAEGYKAKFMVMSELVKHHIQEEEGELFPQAEETEIEWEEIGQKVMKIKERMMKQKGSTNQRRAA